MHAEVHRLTCGCFGFLPHNNASDQENAIMRIKNSADDLEHRAAEALRKVLGQVSMIKLKEIRREANGSVVADVEVLGHHHTLACQIKSIAHPDDLRTSLRNLNDSHRKDAAIPVVIAPYMPPEAQAVCKESHAGFLDLEGNARLAMGEVFIGKRAFTPQVPVVAAAPPTRTPHQRSQAHNAA